MTYVKHLVSKKKRRYKEDGFDLDLAYIKPNIVAMGFPSENFEGVYRNSYDDVIRFLEFKHKDRYKVYNLCSEKVYDPAKFSQRVGFFGFDDHNAPPFELIEACCINMDEWLSIKEDNVAIVHCKAGKGRTGVMICSYLLYKGIYTDPKEAMHHYAKARTENEKGVTIPSQRRYITYFGYHVSHSFKYAISTVLLNSITFVGTPTYASGTCSPSFVIYSGDVVLFKSKIFEIRRNESDPTILHLEKEIPVCGDIKIDFFHHKDRFRKERMFVFWFNTYFLERGVTLNHPEGSGTTTTNRDQKTGNEYRTYELTQYELDKANKDKKNKFFPPGFKIRINFSVPLSKESIDKKSVPVPVNRSIVGMRSVSLKHVPSKQTNENIPSTSSVGSTTSTKKQQQQQLQILSDTPSCLSKSDGDLSREPLSDDDDEEEDVVS